MVESLANSNHVNSVDIILFSGGKNIGASEIYALDQPDTNWLNVSQRGLTLPGRPEIHLGGKKISYFPSYHEWAQYSQADVEESSIDLFPLRSTLGEYLNQRYLSIANTLIVRSMLTVISQNVRSINWSGSSFDIVTADDENYTAREVVVAIGHQPTKLDDELSEWKRYDEKNSSTDVVLQPYPTSNILQSKSLSDASVVAIRGYGLAMIDVMRALSEGRGGKFQVVDENTREMVYIPSGQEPKSIIPYSLDGLPMSPKPINLKIDQLYFPTREEKRRLESELSKLAKSGSSHGLEKLINKVTVIAARVYRDLPSVASNSDLNVVDFEGVVEKWLLDDGFEHDSITSKDISSHKMLKTFCDFGVGKGPVSLDFCVGHVWRHCQPTMYKALSFSNFDDSTMAAIIDLDERLKRYSYGPPLDSLQQLRALVAAEIVTLKFINNPDISMGDDGWTLSKDGHKVTANIMVNSVLDPPAIKKVDSEIVKSLFSQSLLRPIDDGLGIETTADACVVTPDNTKSPPLAVLGRLAKGTLLGVDAILECFNERSEHWASGVVRRLKP